MPAPATYSYVAGPLSVAVCKVSCDNNRYYIAIGIPQLIHTESDVLGYVCTYMCVCVCMRACVCMHWLTST